MSACPINWRRGRDSNPRYAFGVHTLSRRAPSTARTPLPGCNGYRPAAKALKGKPERPPTQRRARRTPCCCAPRAALPIMRAMKTISRMGRETGVSIERDASARSRLVCRATMRSCAALVALLASVALHAQEWTYTYTSRANTAQTSGERPLFGREAASLQPLEDAPSRNSSREQRATVAGPHVQVIWQQGTIKLRTAADRVRDGDRLYAGDAISTGDGGSLALQFAATSRLVLGAIAGDGHTTSKDATVLRLARGRLEHHIAEGHEQPYYIITLAAMATVYGGHYRIATSSDHIAMLSEGVEGTITVNSEGSLRDVDAGFGTRTEIGRTPAAPRPLLPAPELAGLPRHALATRPVSLNWNPSAKDRAYHVQVATAPGFTHLVQDRISHEAQLVAPALPPGDYYLRVRLRGDAGMEGHDTVHRFRVKKPERAPLPVAPSDDAKMARLPLWLTWSATPATPNYPLQVAEDASFTRNLIDIPRVVASYYDLGNQFPKGVYYWRIAAIGRGGLTGTYSTPRRFEVGEEHEQVVRNELHAADSCAARVSDDQIIAPLERTSARQPCESPHGRMRDTGETAKQSRTSPPLATVTTAPGVQAKRAAAVHDNIQEAARHREILHEMDHLILRLLGGHGPKIMEKERGEQREYEQGGGRPTRVPTDDQQQAAD